MQRAPRCRVTWQRDVKRSSHTADCPIGIHSLTKSIALTYPDLKELHCRVRWSVLSRRLPVRLRNGDGARRFTAGNDIFVVRPIGIPAVFVRNRFALDVAIRHSGIISGISVRTANAFVAATVTTFTIISVRLRSVIVGRSSRWAATTTTRCSASKDTTAQPTRTTSQSRAAYNCGKCQNSQFHFSHLILYVKCLAVPLMQAAQLYAVI